MAKETVKPEGIVTFPRREKAPDYVIGTMCIDVDKFADWIANHSGYLTEYKGRSQLKLQILRSKEGNPYFVVDNYQTESKPSRNDFDPFD